MKKLYAIFLVFIAPFCLAQTFVSGGVFSNTTWTKANSPYILTDTVVVFPGVTLTIQPGTTIKFDSLVMLEVRQARIVAAGTSVDSITFTSNSSSPATGKYVGIYLNGGTMQPVFNFCNFRYAQTAVNTDNINFSYTLDVNNSSIIYNNKGFYCPYLYVNIDSCYFRKNTQCTYGDGNYTNCRVISNQTGLLGPGNASLVNNCFADSNFVGVSGINGPVLNSLFTHNTYGIRAVHGTRANNCVLKKNWCGVYFGALNDTIRNSIIDSNVVGAYLHGGRNHVTTSHVGYNNIGILDTSFWIPNTSSITKNIIEYNGTGIRLYCNGNNISCNRICNNISYGLLYLNQNNTTSVDSNYWCTPDSATTTGAIYDAYDNTAYGIVFFMPLDSLCYLGSGTTGFQEQHRQISIYAFPNPTTSCVSVASPQPWNSIEISTLLGNIIYSDRSFANSITIDLSENMAGIYICRLNFGTFQKSLKIMKTE